MLTGQKTQGAWRSLHAWYKYASGRGSKPSQQDLNKMEVEFKALFKLEPPPGEPIPVLVAPFDVEDDVPSKEEIEDAVLGLKSNKPPRPTGMQAEHLKEWLAAARKEEDLDTKCWSSLVDTIQHVFETGKIPT
jgi:hypothetical protein